jgi:hypothetical protein
MKHILLLVNFCRTIGAAYVYLLFMPYFLVYASIGTRVVLRYWPKGHE